MTEALSSWLVIGAGRGRSLDNSANSAFSFSRRFLAALLDFSFMMLSSSYSTIVFDRQKDRILRRHIHKTWGDNDITFIDHYRSEARRGREAKYFARPRNEKMKRRRWWWGRMMLKMERQRTRVSLLCPLIPSRLLLYFCLLLEW